MPEFPEYAIKPNVMRVLIPNTIVTAFLALLFYVGIYINVSLLRIEIPGSIQMLIISVLSLLVVIQGLLTYIQTSKVQYSVYRNRIQLSENNYIMFNAIQGMSEKKGFLDRIFKTGTLVFDKTKVKAIPNFDQTVLYLKQLVQYSKMQYNQV